MELTCISPDEVYLDGHELDIKPSQKRHNHSPTGFMWGYGGSGPAQLSLAVMMEMLKGSDYSPDYEFDQKVKKHYQDFKSDIIAKLPQKPCAVEMDFWSWFNGDKNYRFEVRELDFGEIKKNGNSHQNCTKGYEGRCQTAENASCDCECGGENHGKTRQLTL